LRRWLEDQPEPERNSKTGAVMSGACTDHVQRVLERPKRVKYR
jgi:hypothetical protein